MSELRTVFVVGATGLVGKETVLAALESPAHGRVVAVVRRALDLRHPKLEQRILDFDALESGLAGITLDDAICCLGTTIKKAGSKEAFRRVDHDYVLAFARAARAASARTFVVVTALGADLRSPFFYNRVKGETERDLEALGFPSLVIARPSLLLGPREEMRLGERLAAPFSHYLPARLRGIEGRTVARALVRLATSTSPGTHVVLSDELQRLGA